MNERIHDLRAELRTINEMLDSLTGPMHELALEEQKNLQFELEMLQRNATGSGSQHFEMQQHFENSGDFA